MYDIWMKILDYSLDCLGREQRQACVGVKESQVNGINSLDLDAILLCVVGMASIRTDQRHHRMTVFCQPLGQVNGKNCLSMEGNVING